MMDLREFFPRLSTAELDAATTRTAALTEAVRREGTAQIMRDRAAGKVLKDNPVATVTGFGILNRPSAQVDSGCVTTDQIVTAGGQIVPIRRGKITYFASRVTWPAYPQVRACLESLGGPPDSAGIDLALFAFFPHLAGVMGFLHHDGKLIMNVRAQALAGTHSGMASFPAGLVTPNETLATALIREVDEEVPGVSVAWTDWSLTLNPDAPNVTFGRRGEALAPPELTGSWEAEGKQHVWVPAAAIQEAVAGDSGALTDAFRLSGVQVGEDLAIAPDAAKLFSLLFR